VLPAVSWTATEVVVESIGTFALIFIGRAPSSPPQALN
jgi:hypothetical protein